MSLDVSPSSEILLSGEGKALSLANDNVDPKLLSESLLKVES